MASQICGCLVWLGVIVRRFGWTIPYKSMYFVQLSLELAPLFTGTQDRSSCHGEVGIKVRDFTEVNHSIKADVATGLTCFYPFFFSCILNQLQLVLHVFVTGQI